MKKIILLFFLMTKGIFLNADEFSDRHGVSKESVVKTNKGAQSLQDLSVGDTLSSVSNSSLILTQGKLSHIDAYSGQALSVTFDDGETVIVSKNQPFLVNVVGPKTDDVCDIRDKSCLSLQTLFFREAQFLQIGDVLPTQFRDTRRITHIQDLDGESPLISLTVPVHQTFVLKNGVVLHNKSQEQEEREYAEDIGNLFGDSSNVFVDENGVTKIHIFLGLDGNDPHGGIGDDYDLPSGFSLPYGYGETVDSMRRSNERKQEWYEKEWAATSKRLQAEALAKTIEKERQREAQDLKEILESKKRFEELRRESEEFDRRNKALKDAIEKRKKEAEARERVEKSRKDTEAHLENVKKKILKEIDEKEMSFAAVYRNDWDNYKSAKESGLYEWMSERFEENLANIPEPVRDFFDFCFPAGTPIKTLEGQKNIEDISIGDVVIANDDNNNMCALGEVENVYERDVNTLLTLKTEDGHDLSSSLNHPYFIVEKGAYKRADEIQLGEHVLSVDGRELRVTEIEKKEFDSPKKVYNLNVKEYHTYYAGDSSLLVHNCGGLVEGVGESVKDTFVSIHEALKTSAEEQNRFLEELIAKKASKDSDSKKTESSQDKGDSQSIAEFYHAIADKVVYVIKDFPDYSASEKGELIGEFIGEIAGFFNPTTVGAKGAKVGSKIAKILKDPKHGPKVSKAMKEAAEDAKKARKSKKDFNPKDRVQHEKYKQDLRKEMGKPHVEDAELKEITDALYRPNAKVGSGSTADAARYEIKTGQQVKDSWHSEKAEGRLNQLVKWLKKQDNLEKEGKATAKSSDRAAAENMKKDLLDALGRHDEL